MTCDTFDFTYTEQKLSSCSFLWGHQQSHVSQKFFQFCRQRKPRHCIIGHAQSRVKICLKVKSKYCIMHVAYVDIWYFWHLGKIHQLNSRTASPTSQSLVQGKIHRVICSYNNATVPPQSCHTHQSKTLLRVFKTVGHVSWDEKIDITQFGKKWNLMEKYIKQFLTT